MFFIVGIQAHPLTVNWKIFALLYFHEFHEFCSVAKLKFAKYCNATPFMLPTWIIREIIKITIFHENSWYTVQYNY